jgi:hypothetical protein
MSGIDDCSTSSIESDSESDSLRSSSSLSEDAGMNCGDSPKWQSSKSHSEGLPGEYSSSSDEEPAQKHRKTDPGPPSITGNTSRVRKTHGPGKKNKTAG